MADPTQPTPPGTTVNVVASEGTSGPIWFRILEKHGILTVLVLSYLFMQERTNKVLLETNSSQAASQVQSVAVQAQQTELMRQLADEQKRTSEGQVKSSSNQEKIIAAQEQTTDQIKEQTRLMRSSRGLPAE